MQNMVLLCRKLDFCRKYAPFWLCFVQTFTETFSIWLRFCADIWTKNWRLRVRPLILANLVILVNLAILEVLVILVVIVSAVLPSHPYLYRHARIYGHLWKIDRITPIFLWCRPYFCNFVHVQTLNFRALLCCLEQLKCTVSLRDCSPHKRNHLV